jgi:hypothetical protein
VADFKKRLLLFRGYLRILIFEKSCLVANGDGLIADIVSLYPDLEVLSLEAYCPLTPADYGLIPRLKMLTELNLSYCEVDYLMLNFVDPCLHTLTHVLERP